MTEQGRLEKAENHFAQSWEEEQSGRYERALMEVERAISLAPQQSHFWVSKGHYLLQIGRLNQALEAAQQAVSIDVDNETAWNLVGRLHLRSGQFQEAAEAFRRSLRIRPNHAVYTLLGSAEVEFNIGRRNGQDQYRKRNAVKSPEQHLHGRRIEPA